MSSDSNGRAAAWLDHLARDVRHAARMIARMPGLATVVVVSLAIGIGVNTAIFSWIQGLVFKPIPGVQDAASFQLVEPRNETGSYTSASWLEYQDLRERTQSFRDLLAFKMVPLTLGESGRTTRVFGMLVSGNYFSVLGLEPALGRFLRLDEATRPGSEPVVVISDGFWRTRLASDPAVVGRTHPNQRSDAHGRRCRAATVPGHRHHDRLRPLGAGDDGAGAVRRIARAGGARLARLCGHGTPQA